MPEIEPGGTAQSNIELFPIIGNVRDHFLPELLFQLHQSGQTGTLVFVAGEIKKALVFEDGEFIFASSNLKEDSLGETLVRNSTISVTDFAAAEDCVTPNLRFGEALLRMGAIDEPTLRKGLAYQMHSIIYSLFLWSAGHFRFAKEKTPPSKFALVPLLTLNTILRGTTLIRSWTKLREKLPSLDTRLSPGGNFANKQSLLKLNEAEQRILSSIQPGMLASDICVLSPTTEFETCRFLVACLSIGLLLTCPPMPLPVAVIERDETAS